MSAGSRRCIGFGLGTTAGAAVCALFTTGFGPGWGDRAGLPPAAAAEQLPAFEDCAELRGWYVDAALPLVGPWGFEPRPQYIPVGRALGGDQVQAAVPTTRGTATDAVGNSETGTNVQEADVDEPDVAKTDGQTVYRVQGRRLLRALPLRDGRVAMVDRGVRIIDVG